VSCCWRPAPSGYPDDWQCDEDNLGNVCFEFYGDRWWIHDIVHDNGELYLDWQNQLWDGSGWVTYRHGRCVATVEDSWRVCNKDYYEQTSSNYYDHYGSRVRWRMCDWQDYCWSWTPWYNNDR
jgi:hypothetical protein